MNMIWAILILTFFLILLLIDWQGILKKRIKRKQTAKQAKLGKTEAELTQTDFIFDPVVPDTPSFVEEEAAVSSQVSEEEYGDGYVPSKEIEQLLSEADIHFRKGEMKAAEKFYLQAASQDPRCSKAYGRLGVIYLEYGDNWEDAEAAFRQALKTDPDNGYLLNNLGLVLYHQDKYADAIRQFEQAVRQEETNAARQANLGMAYMAMRQYAKAESSFKKALKLAPNEMEYKDLLNESIEKKKAHKNMIRRR